MAGRQLMQDRATGELFWDDGTPYRPHEGQLRGPRAPVMFSPESDFDDAVKFGIENRGGAVKAPNVPRGWQALSEGRTIGKSVDIPAADLIRTLPILEVSATDPSNAVQLGIVIAPPQSNIMTSAAGVASAGGFRGNVPMSATSFYGGISDQVTDFIFPSVYGVVEWGMGGSNNTALVDIANGASLNLMASQFVRVSVQAVTLPFPRPTGAMMRYSAYVGPGLPKSSAKKTILYGGGGVAAGTEGVVCAVPPFASRAIVMGDAGAGVTFVGSIRFYMGRNAAGAGQVCVAEYLFSANASNQLWCPVPEGAMFFTCIPTVNVASINACFELAI